MKTHCISYPTKSLIFCKLLHFFQNKARIADSLFVCDNSLYCFIFSLILLKLEHALITADLLNQNPTKKVKLLYKNLFYLGVTMITDEIVMIKIM